MILVSDPYALVFDPELDVYDCMAGTRLLDGPGHESPTGAQDHRHRACPIIHTGVLTTRACPGESCPSLGDGFLAKAAKHLITSSASTAGSTCTPEVQAQVAGQLLRDDRFA